MKLIRDNVEFLETLIPIISEPRKPCTPIWELVTITKQLSAQLSAYEKNGKEKPDSLDIESALEAKEFQELLELIGFEVAEMTVEEIEECPSTLYHVKLK